MKEFKTWWFVILSIAFVVFGQIYNNEVLVMTGAVLIILSLISFFLIGIDNL